MGVKYTTPELGNSKMNIVQAAERIKELYQIDGANEGQWEKALSNFLSCLDVSDDAGELELCILSDKNWELSVGERIQLLEKAKSLGASSPAFLKDYYGYLGAHLDPSPEQEHARHQLDRLLAEELRAG